MHYDLALVTTDPAATPAQVVERYATGWSVEVTSKDTTQLFGVGQARNRVKRGVPLGLARQNVTLV